MTDLFDPADFDGPPPSRRGTSPDPGADYRTLLDAMRQAGAEGVGEATRRILAAIQQEADARTRWEQTTSPTLKALQEAAESAREASRGARQAGERITRQALLFALGAALLVAGTSWAALAWQRSEVESLKAQRDELLARIAENENTADKLRLRGADLEWSTCTITGTFRDKKRKCIKVANDTDGANGPMWFGTGTPHYFVPAGY